MSIYVGIESVARRVRIDADKWAVPRLLNGVAVDGSGDVQIPLPASFPVESGTWTPVLSGNVTAGSPVYTVQKGFYTRTGNVVTVSCSVAISSRGGLSGSLRITGFPFMPKDAASINIGRYYNVAAGVLPLTGMMSAHTTLMTLFKQGPTVVANMTESDITDFIGFYELTSTYLI